MSGDGKVAVVTGASSGIGEAAVRRLVTDGFDVVAGARRVERLEALAAQTGCRFAPLDVTDDASVGAFVEAVGPTCHVLVNNAGGALGLDPVESADLDQWRRMYEVNVLGTVRVTNALLDRLAASGDGHLVNIGSVAGFEVYPGGAGYNAAKFGVRALSLVERLELVDRPIRVTEIDPGMTKTEFSDVRFDGDQAKADAVYAGVEYLSADDIADAISWSVTRPRHVNIDQLVIRPRQQAAAWKVLRHPEGTVQRDLDGGGA